MDQHHDDRRHGMSGKIVARTLLYAAFGFAVLACNPADPPEPSPPDSPPKPKVMGSKLLRSGMQPAVFSYTSTVRLPPGHGVLPGPASGKPLQI